MAGSLERRRRPVEGSGNGVGNVSDPGEVQEPLEGPEQDSGEVARYLFDPWIRNMVFRDPGLWIPDLGYQAHIFDSMMTNQYYNL